MVRSKKDLVKLFESEDKAVSAIKETLKAGKESFGHQGDILMEKVELAKKRMAAKGLGVGLFPNIKMKHKYIWFVAIQSFLTICIAVLFSRSISFNQEVFLSFFLVASLINVPSTILYYYKFYKTWSLFAWILLGAMAVKVLPIILFVLLSSFSALGYINFVSVFFSLFFILIFTLIVKRFKSGSLSFCIYNEIKFELRKESDLG